MKRKTITTITTGYLYYALYHHQSTCLCKAWIFWQLLRLRTLTQLISICESNLMSHLYVHAPLSLFSCVRHSSPFYPSVTTYSPLQFTSVLCHHTNRCMWGRVPQRQMRFQLSESTRLLFFPAWSCNINIHADYLFSARAIISVQVFFCAYQLGRLSVHGVVTRINKQQPG